MKVEIKELKKIEYDLHLKLSHRELVAIRSLLGYVGGASTGPRQIVNELLDAFSNLIPDPDTSLIKNGNTYFVDKWPDNYKE